MEPNCVNWDVEKWWVNRPAALALVGGVMGADGVIRPLQGHGTSGTLTLEELELRAEAERIQLAKGSSVSSMLAAGAGYAKKPTLSVSISVHLAEMETVADPSAVVSYFVKIKRGVKKHTTDGAKATPVETLVSVGQDSSGAHSRGSSIGGDSDDDRAPLGGRSPGRTPTKGSGFNWRKDPPCPPCSPPARGTRRNPRSRCPSPCTWRRWKPWRTLARW